MSLLSALTGESTGCRCMHCGRLFPRDEVIEREHSVLQEHGDRLYPATVVTDHCPYCNSDELEQVCLCERCGVIESAEGSDFCFTCEHLVETEEHEEHMARERERRRCELLGVLLP